MCTSAVGVLLKRALLSSVLAPILFSLPSRPHFLTSAYSWMLMSSMFPMAAVGIEG